MYDPLIFKRLWMRHIVITITTKTKVLTVDYDNLDIYFKVNSTIAHNIDTFELEIYDLSEEVVGEICADDKVVISAGYKSAGLTAQESDFIKENPYVQKYWESKIPLKADIMIGHIKNVITFEGGTDHYTRITGWAENKKTFDTKFITKTFEAGKSYADMVREIFKEYNIQIGTIVDPNEYYDTDIFRLEKDETKTQTGYAILTDILQDTNGLINSGQPITKYEGEGKNKKDTVDKNGAPDRKRVSWTWNVALINGTYVGRFTPFDNIEPNRGMVFLSADTGLLEYNPYDADAPAIMENGVVTKSLLIPSIVCGDQIHIKPKMKTWPPMIATVQEITHEHADGGVYYTTLKSIMVKKLQPEVES